MYDAITRETYAELFKKAEEGVSERLAKNLAPVLRKHAWLADALIGQVAR